MHASRFVFLLRLQLAAVALLLGLTPLHAYALSIMDPFNVSAAMDGGAVKSGDGVAYADGPRKKLDVYAPKNPEGKSPIVFFIYGGGWNHGDRGDYAFLGNALASRGFVVVIADYRLYPDVKYPDFLEDNAQALKWVQDNIASYGGDTDRLFIAPRQTSQTLFRAGTIGTALADYLLGCSRCRCRLRTVRSGPSSLTPILFFIALRLPGRGCRSRFFRVAAVRLLRPGLVRPPQSGLLYLYYSSRRDRQPLGCRGYQCRFQLV